MKMEQMTHRPALCFQEQLVSTSKSLRLATKGISKENYVVQKKKNMCGAEWLVIIKFPHWVNMPPPQFTRFRLTSSTFKSMEKQEGLSEGKLIHVWIRADLETFNSTVIILPGTPPRSQ